MGQSVWSTVACKRGDVSILTCIPAAESLEVQPVSPLGGVTAAEYKVLKPLFESNYDIQELQNQFFSETEDEQNLIPLKSRAVLDSNRFIA